MTKVQTKKSIVEAACAFKTKFNRSPRLKDLPNLPFSKKSVVILFKTWNNMLIASRLPLNRQPKLKVMCSNCGKRFYKQAKEIKKSLKDFCSSACNAQFYTTGRKHSQATKDKISASLKAHRIFLDPQLKTSSEHKIEKNNV